MKKDNLISLSVVFFTSLIIYLITRDFFLTFAAKYDLAGGFIKFFILASIGDFVGIRLRDKQWKIPKNIILKAIVWGLIGVVIVLTFGIYYNGVIYLQQNNILPFYESKLALAFFTSLLMNISFAPTMMAFHRMSDTYLNFKYDKKNISFLGTINEIDWNQFIRVVIFKTIPFFWIPAHTITFILPNEYRIIFAAVLGIFLGLLLGLFGSKKEVKHVKEKVD